MVLGIATPVVVDASRRVVLMGSGFPFVWNKAQSQGCSAQTRETGRQDTGGAIHSFSCSVVCILFLTLLLFNFVFITCMQIC